VQSLFEQIRKHEPLYPNIEAWFKTKVLPGIKNASRVAYLGLDNDRPVVSAVLKQGIDAKICHLHIDLGDRDRHIGDLLFSMMSLDAKRRANKIHFTLPESLWYEKKEFFKSFGFEKPGKTRTKYREGEEEFRCTAPFEIVWENALAKLPKIITSLSKTSDNIFSGILMSIKPEHVEKIQSGEKIIEIRKKFNKKWVGCRLTIYSSSPDQAIHGYAKIEDINKDTPERIWSRYEKDIGVKKGLFDEYTSSCDKIYAIHLKNFELYHSPVFKSHIEGLLNHEELKPPQSYLSLEGNEDWSKAVSVAELLHKRFWFCQTYV